jgi:hypothetical protein
LDGTIDSRQRVVVEPIGVESRAFQTVDKVFERSICHISSRDCRRSSTA